MEENKVFIPRPPRELRQQTEQKVETEEKKPAENVAIEKPVESVPVEEVAESVEAENGGVENENVDENLAQNNEKPKADKKKSLGVFANWIGFGISLALVAAFLYLLVS